MKVILRAWIFFRYENSNFKLNLLHFKIVRFSAKQVWIRESCHSWELMNDLNGKQNSTRTFFALDRENCSHLTQKDHLEMSLIRTYMLESFFCHAVRTNQFRWKDQFKPVLVSYSMNKYKILANTEGDSKHIQLKCK